LKADTLGYDPDVVVIAEQYAQNLSPELQANFLHEYDTAVKNIFSTDIHGDYIQNPYEVPSLWDAYKGESFSSIMNTLETKENAGGIATLTKFEKGLYDYLHTGSATKLDVIDRIAVGAPGIKLKDVMAIIEKNS